MLLVWAKAIVFGRLNHLEVVSSSWWGLRWGALLRGERKKRLYRHYFIETDWKARAWYKMRQRFSPVIFDPPVEKILPHSRRHGQVFVFQKVINDIDLFGSIRNHRAFVKQQIIEQLHPERRKELASYKRPLVAMHIRRGDFKLGNQETPLSYFINAIRIIRESSQTALPVTIFSDASKEELQAINELPDIVFHESKSDIVDILLMSDSKILVLSQSSTFSYWAAFLSEALVIMPEADWQEEIRGKEEFPEIKWDNNDEASTLKLVQALKGVKI